jgi:DNA-binding response OmpR family regulator
MLLFFATEPTARISPSGGIEMERESLRGRRILVVEDEIMIAMMLESALTDAGCDVVGPCSSLVEANSAIDLGKLDGAILDINLRGETSFGIARTLMMQHVPIVVVSGYTPDVLPGDVKIESFHEKPFQSAAIMCSLADAIRDQRMLGESRAV